MIDLQRAIADGRFDGPSVWVRRMTFMPHEELEGHWPLDRDRSLFAVARRRDNLILGVIREGESRPSTPAAGPRADSARSAPPIR